MTKHIIPLEFLQLFLIIEISLILILVILILIFNFIYRILYKKNRKIINKIDKEIENFLDNKVSYLKINKKYIELYIEISHKKLVKYRDNQIKIIKIKSDLIESFLLPKFLKKMDWKVTKNRYYLLFLIGYIDNILKYEQILINSICDTSLIVRINSFILGYKSPSSKIVLAMIEYYSKKRYTKIEFIASFVNRNKIFNDYILCFIDYKNDPFWRLACYCLAKLNSNDIRFKKYLIYDSKSNIENLRMKTLKLLEIFENND